MRKVSALNTVDCHEVLQQHPVDVRYREEIVGICHADLIVDGSVVVELKSVQFIERVHRAQCLDYRRATGMKTGLLINFGRPKLEVERIVSRS